MTERMFRPLRWLRDMYGLPGQVHRLGVLISSTRETICNVGDEMFTRTDAEAEQRCIDVRSLTDTIGYLEARIARLERDRETDRMRMDNHNGRLAVLEPHP